MDEPPGPASPEATASRFYPHGSVCPGCGYSLAGIPAGSCPECGAITGDMAYPGLTREISPRERQQAQQLTFTTSWWAVLGAARNGTGPLTGVMLLVAILALVVYPLLRSVDRMPSPGWAAIRAAGAGAGILAAFALVHTGATWHRIRRTAAARRVSLAADLAEGRVEEYHSEITHAMRIADDAGESLVLRFPGGHVLCLRPAAQGRLGLPPDAAVRRRMHLSLLPRSRAVVGIEFQGDETPMSRRPDLRLRRAHEGAGDPVVSAGGIAALIRAPRDSRPPFAPDGPGARPHGA